MTTAFLIVLCLKYDRKHQKMTESSSLTGGGTVL